MKNYTLIDYSKLFFAICIVAIHTNVFDSTRLSSWLLLHAVCRLAVPFFFIASGFFWGEKLLKSKSIKEDLKKYIRRLSYPFFFWLILDYQMIYSRYKDSGQLFLRTIQNLIFYPWGAMWYILALVIAIIFVTYY